MLALGLSSCSTSAPEPSARNWDQADFVAPPTPAPGDPRIELGRRLFYDVRLSINEGRSCGTCHEQKKAFTDGFARAIGTTGEVHARNTLALVNLGDRPALTWRDPTVDQLESQLLVPRLGDNPVELGMGGKEAELLARLHHVPHLVAGAIQIAPIMAARTAERSAVEELKSTTSHRRERIFVPPTKVVERAVQTHNGALENGDGLAHIQKRDSGHFTGKSALK